MSTSLYKQMISIHSVPLPLILLTAGISVGLVTTFWLGWAIWQVALLVILAWLPLFFLKTVSIQRQYGWLAFFFILVVTQGAHVLEHVAQMVQIHLLGLSGLQARGIFGMLARPHLFDDQVRAQIVEIRLAAPSGAGGSDFSIDI